MQREKIRQLIIEHKLKFSSSKGLIKREIQKNLEKIINSREAILITGVRRSGKSSLMKLILDDIHTSEYLYLNFEDERFIEISVDDLETIYELYLEIENPKGKKYFFLDEIQNVKGWERWVYRLYEFEDIKIFITGSNSSLLNSEISSSLTGRNRQITNWPFSFRELLNLRKIPFNKKNDLYITENKITIKNLLKEYFKLGGFPEALKFQDESILQQYFNDIVYRDIVTRHSIRNFKELKELCLYLASNIGIIISYENLKNFINVKSINTVKNYLELLESVYLFFKLPLFDYSIKKQIYNPGKYYIIDTGMAHVIGFKFSENIGRLYENMVFLELKRRNNEVYYWKSAKDKEVDFVIKKGLNISEAIQVCYDLSDKKTKEREINGLIEAQITLNPEKLIILNDSEDKIEEINGIKIHILPLWKWLLESNQTL